MTSIDLYDTLAKQIQGGLVPSPGESRASQSVNHDQFDDLLQDARLLIELIKDNNGDIIRLKERLMTAADGFKQSQICNAIKKQCDKNYVSITELRQKLMAANNIIEVLKKDIDKANEPETLSKIYRKRYLVVQVDKIIHQTFTIQKIVEKYSIETSLKRIRLVLPDQNDQEVRKLANNPKGLQQAVAQRITGQVSKKWLYIYKDMMDKTQGVHALEIAVAQNLRLIKEILFLVEKQGEMIDNILENVEDAQNYVEKAEVVLKKEVAHHKQSRKKMCCIIFIALLVLALILTPIIIKVVQNKKASG